MYVRRRSCRNDSEGREISMVKKEINTVQDLYAVNAPDRIVTELLATCRVPSE